MKGGISVDVISPLMALEKVNLMLKGIEFIGLVHVCDLSQILRLGSQFILLKLYEYR